MRSCLRGGGEAGRWGVGGEASAPEARRPRPSLPRSAQVLARTRAWPAPTPAKAARCCWVPWVQGSSGKETGAKEVRRAEQEDTKKRKREVDADDAKPPKKKAKR